MKIWWPWRKTKQLQSLFEGRIPSTGESPTDGTPTLVAYPRGFDEAHPKNAPGPFYVGNSECMACGYPHVLAPDLMAWETDSEGRPSHCYFKKQPETPEELEQAIKAIDGCCCGALRYSGSDPEIIKRVR
jgi:ferredoxin